MLNIDAFGIRGLVSSVLLRAFRDAGCVRNPPPIKFEVKKKYKDWKMNDPDFAYDEYNHPKKLAWEARLFISSENKLFKAYCFMLKIDPEYLEEKMWKYIKDFDKRKIKSLSKINPIDISKVNTLR